MTVHNTQGHAPGLLQGFHRRRTLLRGAWLPDRLQDKHNKHIVTTEQIYYEIGSNEEPDKFLMR